MNQLQDKTLEDILSTPIPIEKLILKNLYETKKCSENKQECIVFMMQKAIQGFQHQTISKIRTIGSIFNENRDFKDQFSIRIGINLKKGTTFLNF